jgi:hypothetical protein
MHVLARAHGVVERWDDDDQAFIVRFADGQRRRVTANGELGDLETMSEMAAQDGAAPADIRAPALRFLRSASVATIRLGRLDEYNCVRAIEDLIARIQKGAHTVVWGSRLTLRFALPDGELTERQFFDFVGNCENAVLSLRRLMATYDQAAKSTPVWSEDGVAALGHAALALARLDPEAYAALDGYFTRRNAREEWFASREVLPAIADRTRSFANERALRFALLRLPDEELEAGQGSQLAARIITGARHCFTPAAFRREVERTARTIMWRAEIEKTALSGKARMKDVRAQMAAAAVRVHAGLMTPLLRAADPLEDWDFAFIALARRRRSRYPTSPWRWLAAWRRAQRTAKRETASASVPLEPSGQRRRYRIHDFARTRRGGALGPKGIDHDARDEEKVAR